MNELQLTLKDKQRLLSEARYSIEKLLQLTDKTNPELEHQPGEALLSGCGAFVSIHNHGQLRGCYGRMISNEPLIDTVREMAIWSASRDSRFPPVTAEELPDIDIEISVLSPMERISDVGLIIPGKHGIYLRKGYNSGVFLPQVATETGWNTEELLGYCARDKAGIGWKGWKTAEIYVFTAEVFGETMVV